MRKIFEVLPQALIVTAALMFLAAPEAFSLSDVAILLLITAVYTVVNLPKDGGE